MKLIPNWRTWPDEVFTSAIGPTVTGTLIFLLFDAFDTSYVMRFLLGAFSIAVSFIIALGVSELLVRLRGSRVRISHTALYAKTTAWARTWRTWPPEVFTLPVTLAIVASITGLSYGFLKQDVPYMVRVAYCLMIAMAGVLGYLKANDLIRRARAKKQRKEML